MSKKRKQPRRRVLPDEEYLLPHEIADLVGTPDHLRDQVQLHVITGKYVALAEQAKKINGGQPVRVSLARVKEICDMTPETDPEKTAMIAERKPDGKPGDIILVDIATPDEVREANRHYELWRMGASRN